VLSFEVTQGGKAVTDLEEYLGALGHVVVLREGTLDFFHTHPIASSTAPSGRVDFAVTFRWRASTSYSRSSNTKAVCLQPALWQPSRSAKGQGPWTTA
jgi:hypothetical protein